MTSDPPTSPRAGLDPRSLALAALRRAAPWLAVLVIWLVAADTTLTWLRADNTPAAWDQSVHLTHSLYYYAYLTRMGPADAWAGLAATSTYYPPLLHLAGALAFIRFGVLFPADAGLSAADVATLANLLFMLVLLFSTYHLAARWYGQGAGILAAFLVAVYPILAGQSREFLLDYPLTAVTALAMACLAASEGLTSPVWVWPLGLAVSAALWCKWSFAFVFAAPFATALAAGLRRLRAGGDAALTPRRFGFNLAVVTAATLVIAGPWYLAHPGETIAELLRSNQTWKIDHDPAVLSLAGLFYYLRALTESQLFVPFALLAAFGAAYAWLHRHFTRGVDLLLAWSAGGWLALTLVPNKDPRFTMPLLPALAVLSVSWLAPPPPGRTASPRWQRLRLAMVAVVLFLGMSELQAVAFGTGPLPRRIGPAIAPLLSDSAHLTRHPANVAWPHAELAAALVRGTPPGGKIGVLPNTAQVNYLTLRYEVALQLLPYLLDSRRMVTVRSALHEVAGAPPQAAAVDSLLADGFDTVVLMTGDQGAHKELRDASVANLATYWSRFLAAYELAGSYPMPGPEGIVVQVYQRRRE